MKKYFLIISILTFFLFSKIVFAHELEPKTVEEHISEILAAQGIANINQLDCNRVSFLEFADLGDAVMERMIGNHELHEQMDAMMGGEGSESLLAMHTAMGQNWLGCGTSFQGMMAMMPAMMLMMGNYYPGYFVAYNNLLALTIIGWVFVAILVVILLLLWAGSIKIRRK